jgi:2-keto-3-deoxy-galactonokinase
MIATQAPWPGGWKGYHQDLSLSIVQSKKGWRCLPYVTVPCDIVGHAGYRDVSLSNSGQDVQSVPLVMNEL